MFDVQHGSPIQRVIVRTDTSDNVEKRLIVNKSVNLNIDLDDSDVDNDDPDYEKY